MILVDPADIVIPENRIRREFDAKKLAELKDSILRNGLLNPPSVERSGDVYVLRAGERRLRVLTEILKEGKVIKVGTVNDTEGRVPVIEWNEMLELQRLEVEVEENIVRSDFTWQERDVAYAKLHELRVKQNPQHTVKDTADEIAGKPTQGAQREPVAQALITTKYLHIPEVAKAKSTKEALKVISALEEANKRAKLASAKIVLKSPHKLFLGDSKDVLSSLPAESFDCIVTDPPYGVNADSFGDMASTGHAYEDSAKYWEQIMAWLPDELFRVTKRAAHAYIFCDVRRFERLATLMVLANWTVFPTPLVWVKSTGMLPFPDYGPRRVSEHILYAWKGNRKVLITGKPDVIQKIPSVSTLKHGAQKPVALYEELFSRSVNPGEHVLDCFGGTGPILVAANRKRLSATYIEREEKFFHIAKLREDVREIDDGAEEDDGLGDVEL